jgi:uncharacterized protein YjbJ (UPF0337 family)
MAGTNAQRPGPSFASRAVAGTHPIAAKAIKGDTMGGRVDDAKGRAKKAAGELANDPSLKDRGRIDRARGGVKKGVDKAARKAKRGVRRAS